jgi:hypothetical protein
LSCWVNLVTPGFSLGAGNEKEIGALALEKLALLKPLETADLREINI